MSKQLHHLEVRTITGESYHGKESPMTDEQLEDLEDFLAMVLEGRQKAHLHITQETGTVIYFNLDHVVSVHHHKRWT